MPSKTKQNKRKKARQGKAGQGKVPVREKKSIEKGGEKVHWGTPDGSLPHSDKQVFVCIGLYCTVSTFEELQFCPLKGWEPTYM